MVRTAALIAALLAGAAPPQHLTAQEKAAVDAVKARLKDPDAAQFRDLRIRADGAGCGWVNAKNSYGGYVGFSVFFISAGKVAILTPELSDPDLCP